MYIVLNLFHIEIRVVSNINTICTVFLSKCVSFFCNISFYVLNTNIRSTITEVLPGLSEVSKDILEETLQSLGVETHDDFQFIKEEDLLSALRPIPAWKLVAAWSKFSIAVHDVTSYPQGYKSSKYKNSHFMSLFCVCVFLKARPRKVVLQALLPHQDLPHPCCLCHQFQLRCPAAVRVPVALFQTHSRFHGESSLRLRCRLWREVNLHVHV